MNTTLKSQKSSVSYLDPWNNIITFLWETLDYGIHVTSTNYVNTADYAQGIAKRTTANHARDFPHITLQNCLMTHNKAPKVFTHPSSTAEIHCGKHLMH